MNIGISADSLAAKVKALQAKNENDTTNNSTEISKTDRKSRDEIQQKKHQAALQTKDVLNQMNSLLNNTELFSYSMQTIDTKGATFTNSDLASLASTLKDPKPNGQGQQTPSLVNAFVAVLLEILENMMNSTENVLKLQEQGFQGNLKALEAATKMSQTTIQMADSTRDQALSAAASSMASSLISLANGVFGLGQLYKSASTPRNMQTELDHLAKQAEMDPRIKEQFDQFQKDIPQQQATDHLLAQLNESLPPTGNDTRTFKEKLSHQSEKHQKRLDGSKEEILEHIAGQESKAVEVREKPKEVANQVSAFIKEQKEMFKTKFDDIRSCKVSADQKAQDLLDAIAAKPGDLKLDVPASDPQSDMLIQAGMLKKGDGASSELELVSTFGQSQVEFKDGNDKDVKLSRYHQLRITEKSDSSGSVTSILECVTWKPKEKDQYGIPVLPNEHDRYEYEIVIHEIKPVSDVEKEKFQKKEQLSILKHQDTISGILKTQKSWETDTIPSEQKRFQKEKEEVIKKIRHKEIEIGACNANIQAALAAKKPEEEKTATTRKFLKEIHLQDLLKEEAAASKAIEDFDRKKEFKTQLAETTQNTLTAYTTVKSHMTHYAEVGSIYAKRNQFVPGSETPFQRIYEVAAKATSEAEVSYQQTQVFTQSVTPAMVNTLSSISTMQSQQASAQSQELSAQASAVQQQNDASVKIMQQVASDFLSTANTCLEKLLEMIVSTLSVAARALDTRG